MARALSLNTATGFLHPVKEFHSQLFHLQNIALETYCAYSGWKFDTRFEEKKYFSSKQSFLRCHPLTRYSCLHSELQGVLPTWIVSNLNNEACASLEAEPGTGAPLGHTWPARTIPMGPYSLFKDSLSWKTLAAGWGDGPCAAHALQREPGVSHWLRSALPQARRRCWQCTCLAKLTLLLTRRDFSLSAPHFQVAKHSASISSARIYTEGTDCCQNKTLNHQCKTLL